MQAEKNRSLTKPYVESLKPAAKPILAFDASLAGFGVRVMPSGHRSYFVQYCNKHGQSLAVVHDRCPWSAYSG
jgi:hypothetical protein